MNNLELESMILKHKRNLYQAEKDLLVYEELLAELLDKAPVTPETEMPMLETMIKAMDKKVTATKLKIEISKKAIRVLDM